jgi:hypothetical protein
MAWCLCVCVCMCVCGGEAQSLDILDSVHWLEWQEGLWTVKYLYFHLQLVQTNL